MSKNNNQVLKTNFNFPEIKNVYHGKVRDVYNIQDKFLLMVATDRISAFDVVLPKGIPFKGQVLNQIAAMFLDKTEDIVPNWKIAVPDPMATFGVLCEPFKVEMVIRGYLTGHAWREYKAGKRSICGIPLPDGMKEHQKFDKPIITPTTKETEGHDEDISKEEIIKQGLVSAEDYAKLEEYTYKLYQRGCELADERGLILVDTKYEFGKSDGEIYLIDEIHTPDSSRYFYKKGYEDYLKNGTAPKQLSKEFVRQWLIDNGFSGQEGQQIPDMDKDFIKATSDRYIELYEHITGEKFKKADIENVSDRLEENINKFLHAYLRR